MTKTQVQVPDDLYQKAKKIAEVKEWSLAEVFRRGLEHMVRTNPIENSSDHWELPTITAERFNLDCDELDLKQLVSDEEVRKF